MKTPAKIELTSTQNGERVVIKSDGEVYFENETAYVEFDGEAGVRTCIGICPDLVSLSRIGDGDYTMILEEGKANSFDLNTPFGTLKLSANAKKVKSRISDGSIRLMLVYDINTLPMKVQETTVKLKCDFLPQG